MISIIVCSIKENLFFKLKDNISNTIGVDYEIIRIDNTINNIGICRAYNNGAHSAEYEYLCFVHEDVLFVTQDWGKKLIYHLAKPEVGLIGVAGSSYKTSIPSSWSLPSDTRIVNIIQYSHYDDRHPIYCKSTDTNESPCEAVVIDGVFLATRKDVWEKCKFDDKLLTGFHGYDVDYSLQVLKHYKVIVVFDILLKHFSQGNQSKQWLDNAVLISKKWKKYLPTSVNKVSYVEQKKYFYQTFLFFLWRMKSARYPFFKRFWLMVFFLKIKYSDIIEIYHLMKNIR